MSDYYLFILFLLFILAISDLIVGVSNDAVNFLNSAIGSKVTSRRNIMIVASLGILAGATFSSGMMEVARKGIFNPEYFYFSDIMVIFIAVMITDIILLDLFNTFGMPTSTTVSIVFELLGAAVAVSILKIAADGTSLNTLGDYINLSSALVIISGIFISVLIAFAIGSIVQYFSRLLFTFNTDRHKTWARTIWSALALTALTYFLLIKGVSGASFVSDGLVERIQGNTMITLGLSYFIWNILLLGLQAFFKVNVLKIVVLFGTFALAMAFAGNDLVNFIGVPIAGYESYLAWSDSGVSAMAYDMTVLSEPIRSKTYMLVAAGIIMIITLWFSKKDRSVTETEVNLGRQNEGNERFKSNKLSREVVRYSLYLGDRINVILPNSWLEKAEKRFQTLNEKDPKERINNRPAFDLVRASVNLTIASILIAFATSLKLPLSTTYVSFMVAMGTSLADKAWGRNSAVFRLSGVFNVIGGWFFTAILAFTAAAAFATFIHYFDIKAIGILVLLAIFLISRTFILHKKKEKRKTARKQFEQRTATISFSESIRETSENVIITLELISDTYEQALLGLLKEDRQLLQKSNKNIMLLKERQRELKGQLFGLIKRLEESPTESGRLYLLIYDLQQDIVQSISLIVETCNEYVLNSMDPVRRINVKPIQEVLKTSKSYLAQLIGMIKNQDLQNLAELLAIKKDVFILLEKSLSNQIIGIHQGSLGMRNSLLMFTILLESKDLIAVAARFAKLYDRIKYTPGEKEVYLIKSN